MNKLILHLFSLVIFFTGNITGYAQFKIPPKPTKVTEQKPIYDYANILSEAEEQALERKLIKYHDTTSTQIVIATIKTTNGEDVGILGPRWAHQWGIGGSAKKDNGVFILVAEKERRMNISPGYGVEQYLTAGQLGEVIRNVITPEFKAGSYYRGLDKGTTAIQQLLNGTYKGTPIRNRIGNEGGEFPFMFIVLLLIFFFIIWSKKRKKDDNDKNSGGRKRSPSLLDIIILSNMGRGGYSGGSFGGGSSGGGFGGGFGGGGFSGGGASGGW